MDLIRAKKAAGFSLCMPSLVFVSSAQHFKAYPAICINCYAHFLVRFLGLIWVMIMTLTGSQQMLWKGTRCISSGAVLSRQSANARNWHLTLMWRFFPCFWGGGRRQMLVSMEAFALNMIFVSWCLFVSIYTAQIPERPQDLHPWRS